MKPLSFNSLAIMLQKPLSFNSLANHATEATVVQLAGDDEASDDESTDCQLTDDATCSDTDDNEDDYKRSNNLSIDHYDDHYGGSDSFREKMFGNMPNVYHDGWGEGEDDNDDTNF